MLCTYISILQKLGTGMAYLSKNTDKEFDSFPRYLCNIVLTFTVQIQMSQIREVLVPLSDDLVKLLGTGENVLSRADVVKRMWDLHKTE